MGFKIVSNDNLDSVMLSVILIEVFEGYVGTSSEDLLGDGGWIIDELIHSDYCDSIDFTIIPDDIWEKAWDIFDDQFV